jgi:hypothetical protein
MRTRHLPLPVLVTFAACNSLTQIDNLPSSDSEMGGEPSASSGGRSGKSGGASASGGDAADGGGLSGGATATGGQQGPTGGSAKSSGGATSTTGGRAAGGTPGETGGSSTGGLGGQGPNNLFVLPLLDDFNSPASAANWVELGDYIIVDGVLELPRASPSYIFFDDVFGVPQGASFQIAETSSLDVFAVGLTLLATGPNCELITVEYIPDPGRIEIYKCNDSTPSLVAKRDFIISKGQTLAARVSPAAKAGEFVIDVFVDGYFVMSATTEFPASNNMGRIGILGEFPNPAPNGTPKFDNFSGGEL